MPSHKSYVTVVWLCAICVFLHFYNILFCLTAAIEFFPQMSPIVLDANGCKGAKCPTTRESEPNKNYSHQHSFRQDSALLLGEYDQVNLVHIKHGKRQNPDRWPILFHNHHLLSLFCFFVWDWNTDMLEHRIHLGMKVEVLIIFRGYY